MSVIFTMMSPTHKITADETRHNVMDALFNKYGDVGFGQKYTIDVGNISISLGVEQSKQMGSVEHCSVSFFSSPRIAAAIELDYTKMAARAFGLDMIHFREKNGRLMFMFYAFNDDEFVAVQREMLRVVEAIMYLSSYTS